MNIDINEIELRKLDLNLLLLFAALMRERSVGRAAQRLFIGPSAASMALQRLRTFVGDELFVRGRSGMEPTPRAEALWDEIAPALARIQASLRSDRTFDPAEATMTVRISLPDDLEFVLLPVLLRDLDQSAPGLRLIVRPSEFASTVDRLDSGDTELVLGATPSRGLERRHCVRALYSETFSAVFDAEKLGTPGPLDLDHYVSVPHMMLSVTGDPTGPVDAALAAIGRSREVVTAVSHFPTIPHALKNRRMIANIPTLGARHIAAFHGLECHSLPFDGPTFEVSLIWHARTDADPAHRWLRDRLVAALNGIRTGPTSPPPTFIL